MGVLGPAEVHLGEASVELGTRKQRALLAALALYRGRPVSVDGIVDLLWADTPPPGVMGTLQAYVAGLRRALEPDRPARAPAHLLVTVAPGYALRLPEGALDAARFDRTVVEVHHRLAPISTLAPTGSLTIEELGEMVERLNAALGLWRGAPYQELEDAPSAVAERARLEELRLVAVEDRAIANLGLGQHSTVAAELESLTSTHPLRERLWGLRAVALTRSGRQAAALDVLRQVREVLADELGLEPSAELRELHTAVLRQDPALDWSPGAPIAAPAAAPAARSQRALNHEHNHDQHHQNHHQHHHDDHHPQHRPADPARAPAPVPWPMVGRDDQLASLTDALDAAESGTASFAVVVGEPGIGKSRLATELIAVARGRGATVLIGRCSQDDGAPPLWPWASVLRGLGQELPAPGDGQEDEGAQFRTWEQICRVVLGAAQAQTVLVVLDDLHWADPATLRVLRLLGETADPARLMVLTTWRAHPEPSGALADVAETLARRHALRLELAGLSTVEAARVVKAIAHTTCSLPEADALRQRTDGNPFFLVEYSRLAAEGGNLRGLLAEDNPPSAVHDVLVRRLSRLPEETVSGLRTAAVIGRRFDVRTLARATRQDEDDVLDLLDPAQAAGLVRDEGIDRFSFSHALVCDTLTTGLSATRRSRMEVRVAEALEGTGRETELARHWLAAGPAYAGLAWRAAVAASRSARRVHAHEQAASLLRSALETLPDDPEANPQDRYDVLMDLADALRWAGDWAGLTDSVEQAVEMAEAIGDVELLARAAVSTTVGALWQSAAHGQVHGEIVRALRLSLAQLPPGDSALRCRVMLSLANELYYGSTFEERRALVEEGVAMARRLGDDALLLDACEIGFVSIWCARTCAQRLAYVEEAMEIAKRIGSERAFVVAVCLRAVAEGELGLVDRMWASTAIARAEAERLRIPYGLIVIDSLELPWLAMAGRFEECDQRLENIERLAQEMSLPQSADATAGALISLRQWQGRTGEAATLLMAAETESPLPVTAPLLAFLLRSGQREQARAHLAENPVDLEHDDWFSLLAWGHAAEAALGLGERELAAGAYDKLAPYAGQVVCAGSGVASGPVDLFLAQAAAAVGETELAAQHADAALELCAAWQTPLAAQWLRDQRDRYSF